ncbi:MAG: queuosine precursor transporter [Bacteroidota bacterium]|nr:MAG: queuosine precursor transporter [Bacteroidota bacterium]
MAGSSKTISSKLFLLYIGLSAFFLGNAILAQFIGVKIFSINDLFNFPENSDLQINMSIGVIIWPLVFITSDILNEYFGKKGVRRISFISAGVILYASVMTYLGTKTPPASFWLDANLAYGVENNFDINLAYNVIFSQGIGIVIGSVTAFLVSQLVDVYVFHYLRGLTEHRFLWLRTTGSTIVSQLIDSFLILFIAFFVLGNWSLKQVFDVGLVQYIYKVGIAILLTPLIYLVHYFIDRYLGKRLSEESMLLADKDW